MFSRILVLLLFLFLARLAIAADPAQSAWVAAQKAILGSQANGERNRPLKLFYGVPDFDQVDTARTTEAELRQASAGDVTEAQLVYAMQLAGLPRLASRNLPVVFSPLDRVKYPYYPQPPGPVDTVEALRLLDLLAGNSALPDDERFAIRLGLAEMNATLGPSLQDDGDAYAGRIDELLSQDRTGGLGAAILFAAAGRCSQLTPRLDKLASTHLDGPLLEYLGTACSGPQPRIPAGCIDYDAGSQPVGIAPAIRPLEYRDAQAAAMRDSMVSNIVACLWRKTVEMSTDARPPLPASMLQAREKAASLAIGWPMDRHERALFASMGARIKQSNPAEAIRLLSRATPDARLEAARMLVDGAGTQPDAARARQVLASAAVLADAIPQTEIMLADMEFNGIGGPVDRPGAIRRLMKTPGMQARTALQQAYDALPWRLASLGTSKWQP
jgi:hypothetical protein